MLRRILIFLPTLIIVALLLFILRSFLPGDPVDRMIYSTATEQTIGNEEYLKTYKQVQRKMGLHLPTFYITIQPNTFPNNLRELGPINIQNKVKQNAIEKHGFAWPSIRWNGSKNQFHLWISNFTKGDWGRSFIDEKPVKSKIGSAIRWTLFLLFMALILSVCISIPIGIWLSSNPSNGLKRVFENLSFGFFAVPLFWLSTLAVVFLTSDQYGSFFNWFPSIGIDPMLHSMSFWDGLRSYGVKLILPAVCWTLHSMAYLTTQLKVSMRNQMAMDYVTTAFAKGLNTKQTSFRHAFKNAMLPMITLIMGSIPGALAGSIIIENIFNIPGMGRLLINSIYNADWNVMMGIVMITAIITMLSYLLADILYSIVNPKINFEN